MFSTFAGMLYVSVDVARVCHVFHVCVMLYGSVDVARVLMQLISIFYSFLLIIH
jgi:hypothetical protein